MLLFIEPISILAMGLLSKIIIGLVLVWAIWPISVFIRCWLNWRTACAVGAPLGFRDVMAMRWRKVNPLVIIEAYRLADEADLEISIEQFERHHSHGGRVVDVMGALVRGKGERVRVTWAELCQKDLDGENVGQFIDKRIEEVRKTRQQMEDARQ